MNWIELPVEDKLKILTQVSTKIKLSGQSIEKDWWVTIVLNALFSSPFAAHLSFKGGTSLSKCWNLIERFSEDVDIAIDREFLGFGGELSKTQISDKLRRASCSFVRNTLKKELEKQLLILGIDKSLFTLEMNLTSVTTTDPETIEVHYQSVFSNTNYVQNRVLIEVSGRSMTEPMEEVKIRSIIADNLPQANFADKQFSVRVVSPKRTFLEKACLLHEEFAKENTDIRTDRMTRHIYDLEKLMDTEFAKDALNDRVLYHAVIEHRKKFIALANMNYETLEPQTISFVPPQTVIENWRDDYKIMQETMIYGDSLPFDKLIIRIKELNELFRNI